MTLLKNSDSGPGPFTQMLRIFFESTLSPDLPLWDAVKSELSSTQEFAQVRTFLVQTLIQDYNCRLLLKTAQIELNKEPSKFPSVFVEHYSVNETLSWCWNQWVVKQWSVLESKGVVPPQVIINQKTAQEIAPVLSSVVQIQQVSCKPKWRVAAFQLNPKEVLEMSVKHLLQCSPGERGFPRSENNFLHHTKKVEIALKKLNPSPEKDSQSDSNILLAQCIIRLCNSLNYSTIPLGDKEKGHDFSKEMDPNYYLQIPDHMSIPPENIIACFESDSRQIFVEMNSKEFYSQYSETVVILYNYARVKSILERYDGLVVSKQYPELPAIHDIDFYLIGESKDEFPIILMLFMWPRVRQYIINIHRRGKGFDKINLPFLFDFVKSLARAFDSFYNRNVIIVPESAPHNFKAMFARLYLLKAIAVIFKEFIYLSGIEMD